MMRIMSVVVLGCLVFMSGISKATDVLYVCTEDGHVVGLSGMTAGTVLRGDGGDTTFADLETGSYAHKCIAIGPDLDPSSTDGLMIGVGDDDSTIRIFTPDLATEKNVFTVTAPGQKVTGIAISEDLGGLPGAIIATHTWVAADNSDSGGGILVFDNTGTYKNGYWINLGREYTALTIGNLLPGYAGDEVAAAYLNPTTLALSSTGITYGRWNGSALLTGDAGCNFYTTGLAAGELYEGLNGVEVVQTGGNETGQTPTFNGDSSQAFTYAPVSTWKWFNTGDGDPNNGTTLDVVIGDVLSTDPNNEVIAVGNPKILIVSKTGATLQQINVGEETTSVVLADVLGNDGVEEIVVGTSSGKLIAYQHETPNDESTGFVRAAELWLDRQGDGNDYQVSGIVATSAPITMPCIPPVADLTDDCIVDLSDLSVMATNWLADTN